jgi:hypothetical protein
MSSDPVDQSIVQQLREAFDRVVLTSSTSICAEQQSCLQAPALTSVQGHYSLHAPLPWVNSGDSRGWHQLA